jgi:2-oxoglutarate ferredoxin oxidoreductase subunit alpha
MKSEWSTWRSAPAHAGVRAMCATSGGGFALMTEGLGMSAMIETPIVVIDVQRAGPVHRVPTKTEQGDLWQMLGAGHGDYPRVIATPTDILDCFKIIPEMHNLADRFQCPGIVLTDLLLSEGTMSVDPTDLDFNVEIDRGELITSAGTPTGPMATNATCSPKAEFLRVPSLGYQATTTRSLRMSTWKTAC